jgi:isoleucyl-tRNA synthetase
MENRKTAFNFPSLEERILKFWEENKIFEKTLAKTRNQVTAKGRGVFVFYEGPPTANGSPGIHHLEARAFKDVIPRYKTMRGFHVPRKAGWDTHGLPVELGVEKELGFKHKRDIERYGIAAFNEKCRQSVWRYKEEWDRFTKRIGFWLDLERPYITYETSYMETLWWIIKEFWKKGFLYRDFKIVPWCPRCETGLSSHELGLPGAYKKVKDDSIFVRFKIKGRPKEFILVWTTTPWTLPANVAVAVNPKVEYAKFKIGDEYVWSATIPPYDPKMNKPEIIEKVSGKSLMGLEYEPLYAPKFGIRNSKFEIPYTVVGADFVETEEGTGFVHLAPAFGEEDMAVMKAQSTKQKAQNELNYPILETVNPDGTMKKGVIGEGKFVKDADRIIIEDLKKRNLLFAMLPYEHDYPHCWRCDTPLLYYAKNAWWVRVTSVKKKLIENNQTVDWIPAHIKEGRFGEFLREARDWAFSRERYWGTPLPIWECKRCNNIEVLGSLDELARHARQSGNIYWAMRHGEAETQLLGIADDSSSKYHLTDRGKKQVERAAEKLKKEKIDFIIHSDVLRTTETARIVSKILGIEDVVADPRIREVNTGIFKGRSTKEYHSYYSSMEEKFIKAAPQGESLNDLKRRLMDFMYDIDKKYKNKKILLISHEYPIWILDGAARGLDNEEIIRLRNKKSEYIGLAEVIRIPFKHLPRDKYGEVNIHRPYIDDFEIICQKCGHKMIRTKEVADVWFDSGAMPFAQAHWPFALAQNQKSKNKLRSAEGGGVRDQKESFLYPADFIAEAVDQTRGWFYTLLAVATLLGKGAPYRHVISLGHVLDKNGQKMSKSKGNVVNPWEMIQKYGADVIRWYFYTINHAGEPKLFDEKDLFNKLRGFIMTFWNSFILFDTYVEKISNFQFTIYNKFPISKFSNVLDRWVLCKLDILTADVTKRLDRYDVTGAAREIENFVINDFSQWYLRRSRRRFQRPESRKEKDEAAAATAYILLTICKISAPFIPFLAEAIYQELRKKLKLKETSVHLEEWPPINSKLKIQNSKLLKDMEEVRKIVAEALRLRAEEGIKVRQPLAKLEIKNQKSKIKNKELLDLIKDEVNVKEITFGNEWKLDTTITQELKEEGTVREIIRNIQEIRKDLGLHPRNKIRAQFSGTPEFEVIVEKWKRMIKNEAGAKEVVIGGKKRFKAERELDLGGELIWIGIEL